MKYHNQILRILARKLSLTTLAGKIFKTIMAHENVKKEMLASIDQYKNFVEMEQEKMNVYTTALNTNKSKFSSQHSNNSLSTRFFTVPKKIQDAKEELERLLVSGRFAYFDKTSRLKFHTLHREPKS